ncbi:hypothetical protein CARUB_v10013908mg [Capsella rubella]|uniref:F-box domain-containing protein n=1 Tax=Capsella rubella TaxID=81985 RepID=R0HYT7_9BRAS|nr:hypothetical protein CARUB_v10013908mg [Capsella rubella]
MIPHLPHDLESEILSRVPAKSLPKWKTTCKRWYELFRDPRFVKKNFGNAAAREMIVLMNSGVSSIRVDLRAIDDEVDPNMEVSGKLSWQKDSKQVKLSQIFHCDGLILCFTKRNTRLVVWNPCTGQTRWIKPRTRFKSDDVFAIGYEDSNSCSGSFKILRFCYDNNAKDQELLRFAEIEIYEFSSDSWRVLDGMSNPTWGLCAGGVSVKGTTYWVAGDIIEPGFFLLSFDFTTETFGRLPLPYQSDNPEDTFAISVVGDDKIAVLHQNILAFSNEMNIWVTKKIGVAKDLSWSDFVLTVDYDEFCLPFVTNVMSFLLDEENKTAICCSRYGGRTRIYIVKEHKYKEVFKEITQGIVLDWPFLLSYVPSLVNIQKTTPKRRKKRKSREAR